MDTFGYYWTIHFIHLRTYFWLETCIFLTKKLIVCLKRLNYSSINFSHSTIIHEEYIGILIIEIGIMQMKKYNLRNI